MSYSSRCRLRSKTGPLDFEVEVVKLDASDVSAVLVRFDQKLVALAHSIDARQLPAAEMVRLKIIS